MIFHCEYCGKEINRRPSRAKYTKHQFCKYDCWLKWEHERTSYTFTCEVCGTVCTVKAHITRKGVLQRFCSPTCARFAERKPVTKTCAVCGTLLEENRRETCSPKCRGALQVGENNPNYVDGNGYLGYSSTFAQRARDVRKRDGYVCRVCGVSEINGKRVRLEVHHIDHNRMNNKMYNLITLCKTCHAKETFSYKDGKEGREWWFNFLTSLMNGGKNGNDE